MAAHHHRNGQPSGREQMLDTELSAAHSETARALVAVEQLSRMIVAQREQIDVTRRALVSLARLYIDMTAQRDRARNTACNLEAQLAHERAAHHWTEGRPC